MRLVPTPVGPANVFPDASPFTRKPAASLVAEVASILRRPGLESHVFLPGIGWQDGISFTNTIMEDGTQPLSVDQPWGYAGDPVSTVGAELVAVASTWTQPTGITVNVGASSVSFAGTQAAFGSSNLGSITTVAGRSYAVTYTVSNVTQGGVQVKFGPTDNYRNANGTYSLVVTATAGTTGLIAQDNGSSGSRFIGTVSNISVRELVGAIPARQATTANKPILRRGHVNRIRNSTMVGAVAGTPGTQPTGWAYGVPAGISRSIVGTGSENGLTYIDVRFFGTASAANDVLIDFEAVGSNIPALIGQAWTVAATISLVAGAWPTRATTLGIIERNSGNTFLTSGFVDVRSVATGSTPVRVSHTRTLNQATTAGITAGVRCNLQIGDVIDFTVRIAAPQLEQGSVANTFVPTTTAAASASTGPFWAEFDGTDFMSLASVPFQQADDHLVVAAASPQADPSNTIFNIRSTSSTTPIVAQMRVLNVSGNTRVQTLWIDDAGVSATPTASNLLSLGSRFIASARKVGNTRQVRVNAGAWVSVTSALGATTVNASAVGASTSTTNTGFWIGGIYPVIAIKGTITDAELSTIERWVAQQSGVTL